MQLDKIYLFDKGSEEYSIFKYNISRRARRKLGIKFPIFGKYRNKVIIPDNVYQIALRFCMDVKVNPGFYMSDVLQIEQDG